MSGNKKGRKCKLLQTLDIKELKIYKISIKRYDISPSSAQSIHLPLERGLDDPALLKVHFNGGQKNQRIFDRDDIIVNNDEEPDLSQIFLPNPGTKIQNDSVHKTLNTAENKSNNNRPFSEYKRYPPKLPLFPDEKYGYSNVREERNQDKYRYSPQRRRSRSYSSERKSPFTSRQHSSTYKYKSRSRSSSRHRSPDSRKAYCSKSNSRSVNVQASTSGTRRRSRSKSPSSSRRRSPHRYDKERTRSGSPDDYRRSRRNSRSHSPYKYISRKRGKSPHLRPGEYIPKRRSRTRSRSPKLRPGEYIPRKRSRTPESRHVQKRRSRSRSPLEKSKRRSRSFSPKLKPGEYRPRKRSRSPPLRPGEYRPSKHKEWDKNYEHNSNPYDYSIYGEIDYSGMLRPPFLPRLPRPILRPGQILVPHVQFIPYPACPPVRPPFARPPKIYNNRVIPKFTPTQDTPSTSGTQINKSEEDKKEETNEANEVGEEKAA